MLASIIHAGVTSEPLRSRAMGLCHVLASLGISDSRSQISILQFEICNLRCRRPPARSLRCSLLDPVCCASFIALTVEGPG
jgi:hypothetical protein